MSKNINIRLFVLFSLICCNSAYSSDSLTNKIISYNFIIQDSPAGLYTMRKFNVNYLSTYRYLTNKLNKSVKPQTGRLIELTANLFLLPLTHEEGHRSILTEHGIGSISQPYFNLKGAAYVKGVRDFELITLRDSDLPNFIRLHTSGLESDYILCNRIEELILFNHDIQRNLKLGYLVRKLSLISYYASSMIPEFSPKLIEEENELERDIVGHDVYGAIKHLHRPHELFYRYTDYADLTNEEKKFVKRIGYRSLINLICPLYFKPLNIINKEKFKLSISGGYTMCPFGDFIDENFWIKYKEKYNFHAYLRQFENRNTWFMSCGLSLMNYQLSPKLSTTIAGHLWNQPKNLDFNTTESQFGGSGDLLMKYILLKGNSGNSMSIDLGLNYKTHGFLPEEVYLKEHFGVRLGVTANIVQK